MYKINKRKAQKQGNKWRPRVTILPKPPSSYFFFFLLASLIQKNFQLFQEDDSTALSFSFAKKIKLLFSVLFPPPSLLSLFCQTKKKAPCFCFLHGSLKPIWGSSTWQNSRWDGYGSCDTGEGIAGLEGPFSYCCSWTCWSRNTDVLMAMDC